ncbi:hypothetical protein FJTKL_02725 [Diaporthe vaccinii]|uniref:Secreted protein n=1 Tax=Diaporthe vaccinii TaxID=105482 RepID=A0ABR4DWS8_9PEZI
MISSRAHLALLPLSAAILSLLLGSKIIHSLYSVARYRKWFTTLVTNQLSNYSPLIFNASVITSLLKLSP